MNQSEQCESEMPPSIVDTISKGALFTTLMPLFVVVSITVYSFHFIFNQYLPQQEQQIQQVLAELKQSESLDIKALDAVENESVLNDMLGSDEVVPGVEESLMALQDTSGLRQKWGIVLALVLLVTGFYSAFLLGHARRLDHARDNVNQMDSGNANKGLPNDLMLSLGDNMAKLEQLSNQELIEHNRQLSLELLKSWKTNCTHANGAVVFCQNLFHRIKRAQAACKELVDQGDVPSRHDVKMQAIIRDFNYLSSSVRVLYTINNEELKRYKSMGWSAEPIAQR